MKEVGKIMQSRGNCSSSEAAFKTIMAWSHCSVSEQTDDYKIVAIIIATYAIYSDDDNDDDNDDDDDDNVDGNDNDDNEVCTITSNRFPLLPLQFG